MTKQEKTEVIKELQEVLESTNVLYIADTDGLNAQQTSELRRACFKGEISMKVVKNTLLRKAMENVEDKDFSGVFESLKGNSTIFISEKGNAPAKLIQNFRKKTEKPLLKAAWIDSAVFVGDAQLETLANLKSREELIGEIIGLLQSPIKNVVSALKSGGNTIAGLVKTLSEKEE
ncbi:MULTISPECIES: 50S ribosomal protein L10 [Apibacter]|uniref:50S ribosomal protein L10 n=1 Tax=Apibacter TaxID=1778601 RepID=UPI000CF858B6|nr:MULTISPECIES: 50S ribosomal protein L10 [Apibacter]MCX8677051.1 50S ribosomal protein L10 [Apibacter sp. B3919]MXO24568.1 50S ribosomal protein L10 [Apibacter sp. B3924]MXO25812.1 50S ribosomal protein L10 [Apibacter sp. B3813]MXO27763.1 50S ribosomal protein L10 [Apibacter sp. B3913]MXO29877.1 50S ribosomal protein L10 [Apibacter sp. B3912]